MPAKRLKFSPDLIIQTQCFFCFVFSSSPSDRSGIQDLNAVEVLQDNLIRALRNLVMQNHGDDASTTFTKLLLKLPKLRSLNNLHSEELLSFKVHP